MMHRFNFRISVNLLSVQVRGTMADILVREGMIKLNIHGRRTACFC